MARFKKDSYLRKPKPGMLLQALNDFPIDINHTYMIGDKMSDQIEVDFLKTFLIQGKYPLNSQQAQFQVSKTFKDLVQIIQQNLNI